MKPSQKLNELGQSPWLDLIGRKLIHSDELLRLIEEDGIRGVTANPAIFEKAIVESDEYDDELSRLALASRPPTEIYETLAIGDVRAGSDVERPLLEEKGEKSLLGKIAVANAKEAYQVYLRSIATPRWKALEAKGATRQRPLWASTGTKNKAYSDVLYVEPLIGRETVNTMPMATL